MKYMFIPNHPQRSYWEAEWIFPPTSTPVSIGLDGDDTGPRRDFQEWYLSLPSRFPDLLERAKPALAKVFRTWLDQDLPEDLFSAVILSGFGVKDPSAAIISWDMSFETTGEKWLGITIPFSGLEPGEAVVDT